MKKQFKPKIGITLDSVDPKQQEHAAAYSYELWYALRYRYANSIEKAGGIPLALPHNYDLIDDYVESLDGLLITGGGFDVDPKLYGEQTIHESVFLKPKRTSFEYALCKAFLNANKPILGICGGMQLLNVVCGGTLHQHLPDLNPKTLDHSPKIGPLNFAHDILVEPNTKLYKLYGHFRASVNSVHHQAVKQLSSLLTLNASSEDGIIEGFEKSDADFVMGIQWHPEFLMHSLDTNIFIEFIKAAQNNEK